MIASQSKLQLKLSKNWGGWDGFKVNKNNSITKNWGGWDRFKVNKNNSITRKKFLE